MMTWLAAGICVALAGAAPVDLDGDRFVLSWTHSVEKIEWREEWRLTRGGLMVVNAWIKGSGAGMEIPADARRDGDAWVYRPAMAPLARVTLAGSPFTADHMLCVGGDCRSLGTWVHRPAGDDRPVEIFACPQVKNR